MNASRYLFSFYILLIGLFTIPIFSFEQTNVKKDEGGKEISLYFFFGKGCSHCAKAKPFLEKLARKYPQLDVKMYEVWHSDENRNLLIKIGGLYGVQPRGVPIIFIGEQVIEGFNPAQAKKIEATIINCRDEGCQTKADGLIPSKSGAMNSTLLVKEPATSSLSPKPDEDSVYLPFFGEVNLANQSLFVSTLLIAFVDGFNPCSIWVLSILLAITLHSGSRKKIITIGLVYIFVTAAIYTFFMAGLFSALFFFAYLIWIQVVVALVALLFALINIKDYFWYKKGPSLTIAEEKKPMIYRRIRKVMEAGESTWATIIGTIILAAGVSLVEFSCTAGFPVLWSNLLIGQNVTGSTFIKLLLVYMVIYQLDELILFFAVVFSLKAIKIDEKYGRLLKLVAGMLMLTLALVMLFKPDLMGKLSSSLLIFAIAGVSVLFVLVMHRLVVKFYN